jgi:hypothetical protein
MGRDADAASWMPALVSSINVISSAFQPIFLR